MKKLLALVLAGVMAFSLVACGGGEEAAAYDVAEVAKRMNFILTYKLFNEVNQNE